MQRLLFISLLLLLLTFGCNRKDGISQKLDTIDNLCDSDPRLAILMLDSIKRDELSKKESIRYDLLTVKSRDKAYVTHTSDSIILRVIDYYSHHKRSGHYPEALYYGGRVYRDLGDAPSSLRYFQEAIEILSDGSDRDLLVLCLSQKGSLLNELRLYQEASKCIKEVLSLQLGSSDSIKIMRNFQLLGAIFMHSEDYYRADSCFRKARKIGQNIFHKDTLIHDMYLAGIELYKGNPGSARKMIRPAINETPTTRQDIVHAYASQIYLEAGILDSAYFFATKLINSDNNNYRKNGYSMLLSSKLRVYSSQDSLASYILAYRDVLDKYLDRHNAQQVIMQTSLYNYQTHERERKKSEESTRFYMYVTKGTIFFVLMLCIIIMYIRNRSMKTLLQYRKALDDIALLRKMLSAKVGLASVQDMPVDFCGDENGSKQTIPQIEQQQSDDCKEKLEADEDKKKNMLRERLKEELLSLQKAGEVKREVPENILTSPSYGRLQEYLIEEKRIPYDDTLWSGLEEEVLKESPTFKSGLYLLAGDRLKEDAFRMALLIKCGITPTQLTILVGRSKGAVSSRRGYICEMIFGQKLGAKVMDDIIRLL